MKTVSESQVTVHLTGDSSELWVTIRTIKDNSDEEDEYSSLELFHVFDAFRG